MPTIRIRSIQRRGSRISWRTPEVLITIYDTRGSVIRQLDLGHQREGYYTNRNRAAYWDGRNDVGERVASGVYFYQLETDNLSLLRKMVILEIVSNDHRIAGMLMFISFPVIADEWVELGSLASSLRNDAFGDQRF